MKLLSALTFCVFAAFFPTQENVQKNFDALVASADSLMIRTGGFCHRKIEEEKILYKTDSKNEISKIGGYFRFRIPPPKEETKDGRKLLIFRNFSCNCCGDFTLAFSKNGEEVLSFSVHHGEHVRGAKIREDSDTNFDPEVAKPLIKFLLERFTEIRANQSPEPTPTTVTPPAGQEARQP